MYCNPKVNVTPCIVRLSLAWTPGPDLTTKNAERKEENLTQRSPAGTFPATNIVKYQLYGRMKRIEFKFKHERAEDNKRNQEWTNYPVREYPKLPAWIHFAGFGALASGIGIGFWMGGGPGSCAGFFAGMTACFILVVFFHPLRCPQCKGSVNTSEVEEENGFKRFFHNCPVCKISWRCEKRHWDSSAD